MTVFRKLIFIQLKHMLSVNSSAGKKKQRNSSIWVLLLVLAVASLYIGSVYAFTMASTFHTIGALDLLFVVMTAMATGAAALITTYGVSGLIYQAKDMSFLMGLPIKSHTVLLAKIMAVYGEAFLVNLFIMLPSVIAYLRLEALPVSAYLFLIPVLIILPLLATTVALILGYFISLVMAKTSASPLIKNGISLLAFGAVMYFSFSLQPKLLNSAINPDAMRSSLLLYARPFYWVRDILIDGNMVAFLLLAVVCLVPFGLIVWLLSRHYLGMVSSLATTKKSTHYRGPGKQQAPLTALMRKEFKQYFNSPAYFMNTIVGPLMMIAGAVYLFIQRSMVLEIVPVLRMIDIPLGFVLVAMMIGILSMSNTTAPSISLEGSRLWILKTLPVQSRDIFKAKILLNLALFLPPLIVTAVVLNLMFPLTAVERIMLFVIPFLAVLASSMIGLIANLIYPKLDAPSDTAAVKNSASVFIGSFGVFILTLIIIGVLFMLRNTFGNNLLYLLLAIYLILNPLLYRYLLTRGSQRFQKII